MDPFAEVGTISVFTNADGFYKVDLLPPGFYEIVEVTGDPASGPLAGYIDGKASLGTVGGVVRGTLR